MAGAASRGFRIERGIERVQDYLQRINEQVAKPLGSQESTLQLQPFQLRLCIPMSAASMQHQCVQLLVYSINVLPEYLAGGQTAVWW